MNEIDVIDILDPVTDEVVTHCFGPTTAGKCPLASPDGIVHCHGARIEARNLGRSSGISGSRRHLQPVPRRGTWTKSVTESPHRGK